MLLVRSGSEYANEGPQLEVARVLCLCVRLMRSAVRILTHGVRGVNNARRVENTRPSTSSEIFGCAVLIVSDSFVYVIFVYTFLFAISLFLFLYFRKCTRAVICTMDVQSN